MNELKTLKDLKTYTVECKTGCFDDAKEPITYVNELKQEAIKWLKEIANKEYEGYIEKVCINPCDEYSCHAISDWIKHFFNITEDDLK